MSKGESKEYRTRLKEITSVLHKYGITRGITPQKLRMILEDLGPTYIKIGQIMSLHSDILPKRYCDELMCLRSEVTPMEFSEVKEVIERAYGCPWNEIFAFISDTRFLWIEFPSRDQILHSYCIISSSKTVIKVQLMCFLHLLKIHFNTKSWFLWNFYTSVYDLILIIHCHSSCFFRFQKAANSPVPQKEPGMLDTTRCTLPLVSPLRQIS